MRCDMKVLVLDIGCSNTKKLIYQQISDNKVLCLSKDVRPTPSDRTGPNIENMVELCSEFISGDWAKVDCIITTSFSNSVVVETTEGAALIHPPERDGSPAEDLLYDLPLYTETGYSTQFPHISQRLHNLEYGAKVEYKRRLPVSAYISSKLCDNNEWNIWDWTHASNSGNWNQEKQQWIPNPEINKIPIETVSPAYIIGCMGNTPVMVGGHDTLFISANDRRPYIYTGTYTTVSFPQAVFTPDKRVNEDVRWLLDPIQNLHEQLLLKTPSILNDNYFAKIIDFIGDYEDQIVVAGSFVHTIINTLNSRELGCSFIVHPHIQHAEAAKFALRHLYHQSMV